MYYLAVVHGKAETWGSVGVAIAVMFSMVSCSDLSGFRVRSLVANMYVHGSEMSLHMQNILPIHLDVNVSKIINV